MQGAALGSEPSEQLGGVETLQGSYTWGGKFLAVRDEACRQEPCHVLLPPTAPGAISNPTAPLFALAEFPPSSRQRFGGVFSPKPAARLHGGVGLQPLSSFFPSPPVLFSWGRSREVPLRAGESGRTGERLQEPRCTGRTSPGHSVPAAEIVRS